MVGGKGSGRRKQRKEPEPPTEIVGGKGSGKRKQRKEPEPPTEIVGGNGSGKRKQPRSALLCAPEARHAVPSTRISMEEPVPVPVIQ